MNKKEVAEIKRTLRPDRCCINNIASCYVTAEKEKFPLPLVSFPLLLEEEAEKYAEIFKKTLSGTIGKTLSTLTFPMSAEGDGTTHDLLLQMKDSRLKNNDALNEFYERVIAGYTSSDPYCIILMSASYEIPSKGGKDTDAVDDSAEFDSAFDHIICCICPTTLSKPRLAYDPLQQKIEDSPRNWLISLPSFGFLFPAFHDRKADIHSALCYTKRQTMAEEALMSGVLGCQPPVAYDIQAENFA